MDTVKLYCSINNSFKKKLIFHVGTGAGFYSEINGMLMAMLYCYVHKIKFILYADDATFAGKKGWNEFFMPFCPQSHDELNHKYNIRSKHGATSFLNIVGRLALKVRNRVDYLTSDIFGKACLGSYSKEITYAHWHEFGINGDISDEFVKLRNVALRYNKKTFLEIKKTIKELNLPTRYYSIQFRGGDKTLEATRPMDVNCIVKRIREMDIKIDNIFIFTDDFSFVDEIKEICPEWNIYTLTKEDERGYINADFNKAAWYFKRKQMIKLFAMTEICIHSDVHFGCEVTCVNDFIKNIKEPEKYKAVWTEEDAGLRDGFANEIKKEYG